MKRTLLLICTLLCANVLMAQEQLATLKHNGNISVYYGVNAFVEAYNAASNGDTINLSDGNFNGTNISKRLVLRGNGAITDTARGSNGTLIAGNVTLHLQDSLHVEVEGINFQNNLELNNIAGSSKIKLSKCVIEHLKAGSLGTNGSRTISDLFIVNCIIRSNNVHPTINSLVRFYNCVIRDMSKYSFLNNCIIIEGIYSGGEYNINNNIIFKGNDNFLNFTYANSYYGILCGYTSANGSNNTFMNATDVFETWNGYTSSPLSTNPETYRLKENVANTILGNDGTQVGIFGGAYPFDFTPSYTVIRRLNVSQRTNAEGMLGIEVELMD